MNIIHIRLYSKASSSMIKGNYEFSFDSQINQPQTHEEISFATFLKDIFPYFTIKSTTFCLLIAQTLWFLLQCSNLTVLPQLSQNQDQRNLFLQCLTNLAYLLVIGRLGSEYQAKLGSKFYLPLTIIIQIIRFVLVFFLQYQEGSFIMVGNSSLLSLCILSTINIQKWKQNGLQQYQPEEKSPVENYDLLDLNNTIIKLKPSDSAFMYESYTNRQFYHHNMSKEDKQAKNSNKTGKKHKKSSKFIEEMSSQGQTGQLLYFKLILCHYIVFSLSPYKQFLIFVFTQCTLYALFATKVLRKMIIF